MVLFMFPSEMKALIKVLNMIRHIAELQLDSRSYHKCMFTGSKFCLVQVSQYKLSMFSSH